MTTRTLSQQLFTLLVFVTAACFASPAVVNASPPQKVLIVVEGSSDLKNYAMGDGRQLATLLGHFNTVTTVHGSDRYQPNELNAFDYVFYVGFHAVNQPPSTFVHDVVDTEKPVIWMNTGFKEVSSERSVRQRFGFFVSHLDTGSQFDIVRSKGRTFQKGEPNLSIIEIVKNAQVTVLATAVSSKTKREFPYIVQSRNLTYIADSRLHLQETPIATSCSPTCFTIC